MLQVCSKEVDKFCCNTIWIETDRYWTFGLKWLHCWNARSQQFSAIPYAFAEDTHTGLKNKSPFSETQGDDFQ